MKQYNTNEYFGRTPYAYLKYPVYKFHTGEGLKSGTSWCSSVPLGTDTGRVEHDHFFLNPSEFMIYYHYTNMFTLCVANSVCKYDIDRNYFNWCIDFFFWCETLSAILREEGDQE